MLDYGLLALRAARRAAAALLGRLAAIEAALGLSRRCRFCGWPRWRWRCREDADRLRERLRLSNEEHARLSRAALRAPRHWPGSG